MKKRKSPFALVVVLALLFVVVIFVNARSHGDSGTPEEKAQQAQQQAAANAPTAAPDAKTLSNQLASQVKGKGVTQKKPLPMGGKSMLVQDPSVSNKGQRAPERKPDPTAGVAGGWYNKDSALNDKG